jgi:glycosyltransferase involved in cell wall biosynthesis
MRVCYFGTYTIEEGYPMNEVLIQGLRENEVDIIQCHHDLWQGRMEKVERMKDGPLSLIRLFFRIVRAYLILSVKFFRIGPYDAIIVGYPGHLDFFLAKVLNSLRGRKPLLINLLFSLHDTVVHDRRLVPEYSLRSRMIRGVDRRICIWADRVILDTKAHIDYFRREFGISADRFLRVPVGADDTFFQPRSSAGHEANREETRVLFFGTYIPLHGIDTILRAADRLRTQPDIRFTLIGSGQTYDEMRRLASSLQLQNVTFIPQWVAYADLARYLQETDICLGIFGTTDKARRVIPCKIYNGLSMGKATITADTPAAREFLVDGTHAVLSPPGDPEALAKAILRLRDDPEWRERIGRSGYDLFRTTLTPRHIGQDLKRVINDMISSKPR